MKQGTGNSMQGEGKPTIISHAVSPKEVARLGVIQSPGTRKAPDCVVIGVTPPVNTLTIHHRGTQK